MLYLVLHRIRALLDFLPYLCTVVIYLGVNMILDVLTYQRFSSVDYLIGMGLEPMVVLEVSNLRSFGRVRDEVAGVCLLD